MPVFRASRPKTDIAIQDAADEKPKAASIASTSHDSSDAGKDNRDRANSRTTPHRSQLEQRPSQGSMSQHETNSIVTDPKDVQKSWYGGTWPRTPAKALPVTQLVTENNPDGGDSMPQLANNEDLAQGDPSTKKRTRSLYLSPGASVRSQPSTGTTSRVSVSTPRLGHTESCDAAEEQHVGPATTPKHSSIEPSNPLPNQEAPQTPTLEAEKGGDAGVGWGVTSWLPGFRGGDPLATGILGGSKSLESRSHISTPASPHGMKPKTVVETSPGHDGAVEVKRGATAEPLAVSEAPRPKSWFGMWSVEQSTGQTETKMPNHTSALSQNPMIGTSRQADGALLNDIVGQTTLDGHATQKSGDVADDHKADRSDAQKQGRWSWWAKSASDKPYKGSPTFRQKSSQENGTFNAVDNSAPKIAPEVAKLDSQSRKRERPASSEIYNAGRIDKVSKQGPDGRPSATAAVNVLPDSGLDQTTNRPVQRDTGPANLILPLLKETYCAAESPGLLERLAQYFFTSRQEPLKRVSLVKEPSKIKHAIAIGVHGYFPAPFIRTMIGQPRGTSVKFATMAETAIRKWSRKYGCDPKVDKVVLEGEGRIEERVVLLWQLLIQHIAMIKEADLIVIACHSQGVPVAVQLVEKLIQFGVMVGKRTIICAMAGVNLGPFPEYKSRWIGGSAGELFEFAVPESQVSVDHSNAIATVLQAGTKVLLVGSIDDQLVSMDSATFGNLEHPSVYRAAFINGEVHAPSFVVNLVGFALKLRNLGIPDHGLIRELSNSLAGSFTGDGHSRLYEDPAVYDLAVEFALETTPCERVSAVIQRDLPITSQNPYILPFAMRGVLEEKSVKSDLHHEMDLLLSQFDQWKPTTKQLKDVKFRLEGVRSKI